MNQRGTFRQSPISDALHFWMPISNPLSSLTILKQPREDKANPFGAILSSAMLLRYGLGEETVARKIKVVVLKTLDKGFRTRGIYSHGKVLVGCKRIGEEVLKYVDSQEMEVTVVGSM